MGSLSSRYAHGGGPRPNRSKQKRGPLRKVVGRLSVSRGVFESELVVLECGHRTTSWGGDRARCVKCGEEEVRRG